MKYKKHICPTCKEPAIATLETVEGWASLDAPDDNGEQEYTGETETMGDTQETVKDAKGRVTLKCDNGHLWQSAIETE